jgi:hypothetical protein
MAFKDTIAQLIAGLFLEIPAKSKSFAQLRAKLEQSGRQVQARLEVGQPNPVLLAHIIQIERWGQNRLRSSLAETPFEMDQSSKYAPDLSLDWSALRLEFDRTRQVTLELVDRLELGQPVMVAHNQLGPMSAKAWLWYLNLHANLELRRLRSA